MRNLILMVVFLLAGTVLFSQVPDGYYNTAEGLTGENLKGALYNIIKGHKEFPYTSDNTDVWDILKETDKDTLNPENVILFYTGWSVNAAQEYNNASGWSREHVWAKSRGDFGTLMGPGTDAHHLRPADISVNSARNNRWFDNCTEEYYDGGIATGCFTSSTSWVWQPRKEVKGDVARMIFYMSTRYEGENGEPDLEITDYLPADDYTKEPIHARLGSLLQWHNEDPVDDWERNRNEVIYGYQNNRNPFIDHPEYVSMIWSVTSSSGELIDDSKVNIYPNPAGDYVKIDNPGGYYITLFTTAGLPLINTRGEYINLEGIAPGSYIIVIEEQPGSKIYSQKIIVR